MKGDQMWLTIEIVSILLTYAIAMMCLVAFLLGFADPITLLEGCFLAVSWWVVSLKIKEYRYETFHPPNEKDKVVSVKSK